MPTLDEVIEAMEEAYGKPTKFIRPQTRMRAALLAAQKLGASLQPDEATEEQIDAAESRLKTHLGVRSAYKAMAAASPYVVKGDNDAGRPLPKHGSGP